MLNSINQTLSSEFFITKSPEKESNKVSHSIDKFINSFFESLSFWFKKSAEWIWSISITFINNFTTSINSIMEIVAPCFCCQKDPITENQLADWYTDSSDDECDDDKKCSLIHIPNRNTYSTLKELNNATKQLNNSRDFVMNFRKWNLGNICMDSS
jgi:hypothetical protein